MGNVRETLHIEAPPERVWELASDCDRIMEWQTGISEIRDCPGRLDVVGARYSWIYKAFGRKLEGTAETTKVERPRLMEQRLTTPGGGTGTSTVRLEPAGGGTDMTVDFEYELPGGFFGDMADKLFMERAIDSDLRHSNENFKALCEAKAAVHA